MAPTPSKGMYRSSLKFISKRSESDCAVEAAMADIGIDEVVKRPSVTVPI